VSRLAKNSIYWAGYHPEKSVQAKSIHFLRNEFKMLYGDDIDFKFVSDVGDLGYNAIDLLHLVEDGRIDCCYFFSSYLTERVNELNIFEIPFQISSREMVYNLLDGEIGEYLSNKVELKTGYKVIGWWDNGIRHLTSNKKNINSIDDCKNLTIRIAKNSMHKMAFESLGFVTKFVDVKNLKNAIIQNEIDTQENPLTNIINYGIEKYHKYITLSSHLYGTSILLCNKKKYYSWDKPFQDNLITLIRRATVYQRQLAINEDEKCMKYLRMNGAEIIELNEILRDEMKLKCLEVAHNVIEKFPDHIRKIL
tara:strand:- start:810 stop:1733 length:924 start_codon:yes stop_codon:yes gene_type:complete